MTWTQLRVLSRVQLKSSGPCHPLPILCYQESDPTQYGELQALFPHSLTPLLPALPSMGSPRPHPTHRSLYGTCLAQGPCVPWIEPPDLPSPTESLLRTLISVFHVPWARSH